MALADAALAQAGGRQAEALCAAWWVTGLQLPRQRGPRDAARTLVRRRLHQLSEEP